MKLFLDREDGAAQLAPLIHVSPHEQALVLAIPRGGVITGKVLCERLKLNLDIILCKKVGHPENPEYAVGSVCADGTTIQTVSDEYLSYKIFDQKATQIRSWLISRYKDLTGKEYPTSVKARTVILTDDGMATGSTMLAAIRSLRLAGAKKILVAVPVASTSAADAIRKSGTTLVCPYTPEPFNAVGEFYDSFPTVTDDEVRAIMKTWVNISSAHERKPVEQ
ncbi:MAG: phosphoribosyltransferase [Bacteroidetes bacterium]|nr:phosphoribosyltransferase [Bacteroidota bacterium]